MAKRTKEEKASERTRKARARATAKEKKAADVEKKRRRKTREKLAKVKAKAAARRAKPDKAAILAKSEDSTRALLSEAIASLSPRIPAAASGIPVAGALPDGAVTLLDTDDAPLFLLRPPLHDELRAGRTATQADHQGLQSLLTQVPQAALTGLLLGQLSRSVVLHLTPELAAKVASGVADFQTARTIGFRAVVAGKQTGQSIGAASFTHAANPAMLGIAAAWQVASLLVAQKHLYDISARLGSIERSISTLRDQSESDLIAEIEGDAAHLASYLRHMDPLQVPARGETRAAQVDGILRDARTRHRKIAERIRGLEPSFLPGLGKSLLGPDLFESAEELAKSVDRLTKLAVALRLNALLFLASVDVLGELGETERRIADLREELDRAIAKDDAQLEMIFGRVQDSILGLDSFRTKATEAAVRRQLAEQVHTRARVLGELRKDWNQASQSSQTVGSPRVLLELDERDQVVAASWIEDASPPSRQLKSGNDTPD